MAGREIKVTNNKRNITTSYKQTNKQPCEEEISRIKWHRTIIAAATAQTFVVCSTYTIAHTHTHTQRKKGVEFQR